MKVAFFEVGDWEEPLLRKTIKGHTLKFFKETLSASNAGIAKDFDIISVFIYSKVNIDVLNALPSLKMVATRSTGFDHVDVATCIQKGVVVCNVPTYGENTVAEHAFALLLSLSKKVHKSYARALKNDFSIEGLKGFDLQGKTIGVVGSGRIGLNTIKISKGFGMKVLAFDVVQNRFMQELLDFEYVTLRELLKRSDVISIHTPYTQETHHLIDKKAFRQMKKGAVLINTARGSVVDTEALFWALDKGILSCAGLDVLEGEEFIKGEKEGLHTNHGPEALKILEKAKSVISRDDVIFTPHSAFFTQEALERIVEVTRLNIQGFLDKKMINTVRQP